LHRALLGTLDAYAGQQQKQEEGKEKVHPERERGRKRLYYFELAS
jgi:hypothetical protein